MLANRLSANPRNRVLLIEAGGPETDPRVAAPGKWTSLLGSELDWDYSTEPRPASAAARSGRAASRGGSSAINAMAYTRGHRLCYRAWQEAAGTSWVTTRWCRCSNERGQLARRIIRARRRRALAVPTRRTRTRDICVSEAARDHGFEARADFDFDGPRQERGAGFYQKNIKAGRRHSAAAAYLVPALSRSNLVVWSRTQALKLAIQAGRATGVDVLRGGERAHARARREIILSAGAIESPKLLMLSGIGPADALRKHGIAVQHDAPGVGSNLQDHLRVSVRWAARQPLAPTTVSAGLFTFSKAARRDAAPDLQFYGRRGLDAADPFVTLTVAMSQPSSRGAIASDPPIPSILRSSAPTT